MLRFVRAFTAIVVGLVPVSAWAAGAWNVYIRPSGFRDVVAQRETVWVSTKDAGLLRYLRSADRFESVVREPGGLASNDVTVMEFDRSGRLWTGTNGVGASRLSADGLSWRLVNAFDGLPSDSVLALAADGDTMWIGTARGIALWNGRTVSGSVPDGVNPSPFASNDVRGVAVFGDTLFVGTSSGAYLARRSEGYVNWTRVVTGMTSTVVEAMVTDTRDVFALAGGATYRWNRGTGSWGVAGGNGSVRRLREDFSRITAISTAGLFLWGANVWSPIAGATASVSNTGDGGVEPGVDPDGVGFALPDSGLKFGPTWQTRVPPGPIGNDLSQAIATNGVLYVGTQQAGLSRFRDGVWKHWSTSCSSCTTSADPGFLVPVFVYGMHLGPNGSRWFGMWGGRISKLYDNGPADTMDNRAVRDGVYDPTRHSYGWSSVTDGQGRTWIGLDTPDRGGLPPLGIDLYDASGQWLRGFQPSSTTGPNLQPGLNNGQIRALDVDKNGRLWIGYAGAGLDRATISGDVINDGLGLLDISSSVGILDVFGIRASGDSLWILSTDGLRRMGINQTAITGSTPTLSIPGAVAPRGAVHPLEVARDGSVWVATTLGVRHYKVGGGFEDFTFDNSPLPSNEVRSVRVDPVTGVLWFATGAGVASYDPGYTPPTGPRLSRLNVRVYPNPVAQTGIGFDLKLVGDATSYEGTIHDLSGRVIRHFDRGANGGVFWNGRDDDGHLVPPGLYFVRVKGGGAEATARLAVVR